MCIRDRYGVPVILHTDHCQRSWLPWFDGLMAANEDYFKKNGEPLFSSHMLDLSEETDPENIETCVKYFKRMAPMKIWLEMEIGITGGVEDGVDNSGVANDKLYTSSEQVFSVYEALSPIAPYFSIAAAFGNVHGVYKPGNVKLSPELLGGHQTYAAEKTGLEKPLFLVFHGGSGSTADEIATAVKNGVVKMNIDTDTRIGRAFSSFTRRRRATSRGRLATPTARTSRTRATTIRASGCASPRARWSSASSRPSRSLAPKRPWPRSKLGASGVAVVAPWGESRAADPHSVRASRDLE